MEVRVLPEINVKQLRDAVRNVAPKHEFYVTKALALSLAEEVKRLYEEGWEFPKALRKAMDGLHFDRDTKTRAVYREIMGAYFGKHGGEKSARNRGVGSRATKPIVMRKKKGQIRLPF